MKSVLKTGVALVALAMLPGVAQAASFDAVALFASAPASAVPFTYGYRIGAAGFIAYDASTSACAGIAGLSCNYASSFSNNNLPAVGLNTTGSLISVGSVRIPTDALFMHPVGVNSGLPSGATLLRFTAPSAGFYNVTGDFTLLDTSPSGVFVSVEGGSSSFAQSLVGPLNTTVAFSFGTALSQNQTLDFAVEAAGSYNNDSTGLRATIVESSVNVPEPASLAVLGLGLLGIMFMRQRCA